MITYFVALASEFGFGCYSVSLNKICHFTIFYKDHESV